jgi:hypothetical protein
MVKHLHFLSHIRLILAGFLFRSSVLPVSLSVHPNPVSTRGRIFLK